MPSCKAPQSPQTPPAAESVAISSALISPVLGRVHTRRLREIYRSAGWPCQDLIEVELLAAGMLTRITSALGHETLRVTDAGIALLAATLSGNRAARSDHELLVLRVAREMARAGRVVWTGLSLRARVPMDEGGATTPEATAGVSQGELAGAGAAGVIPPDKAQWVIAMPDVFSIRNTTVEAYVHPVVHEIKVRRSDLLGDLKKPAKRAAYLDLGGECWYVLGTDAKGRSIGEADEIPTECGVMLARAEQLSVLRPAPRRAIERLPFAIWLELAKRTPLAYEGGDQAPLTDLADPAPGDGDLDVG